MYLIVPGVLGDPHDCAKLVAMDRRLMLAATEQAEMGRWVFPCRPGSKLPAVQHWQTWATRDVEKIERMWFNAPYNIGIACGPPRWLIVDCDVKDGVNRPDSPGDCRFSKGDWIACLL